METRNITVPETAEYIQNLYDQPDPFLRALRERSQEAMVPILLGETEPLLQQLVLLRKPQNILEIGTAVGYGAICFGTWAPEARVTTIESAADMVERARSNIADAGLSQRVTVLEGDARDVLVGLSSQWTKESQPYDFIFIDAGKGHYLEFWELCLPMMARDCIVASDNVLFKGLTASDVFEAPGKKKRKHRTIVRRLRRYLDYLTHQEGLLTAVLAVGDGLAITTVQDPQLVRTQWEYEHTMENENEEN
ncbi:MAG: O-methyltransferase [Firmicutes bacterium]|nr:O-methyltransferase [Bacillota bacterium]